MLSEGVARHGDVIFAGFQSKGKGQAENSWESKQGMNLLFSLVLEPVNFQVESQIMLNMAVALALNQYLKSEGFDSFIKWPNDLYVNKKKVAGILIENSLSGNLIKSSIIGIGLNLNQVDFNSPNASSLFAIDNRYRELNDTLKKLLLYLGKNLADLINQTPINWLFLFNEVMYLRNQVVSFTDQDHTFEAKVEGCDESGRLILIEVETGNKKYYHNKEVKWNL